VYYQSVISAKVIYGSVTKISKGFGFVKFIDQSEAISAIQEMNGRFLYNRPIKVNQASWKKHNSESSGNNKTQTQNNQFQFNNNNNNNYDMNNFNSFQPQNIYINNQNKFNNGQRGSATSINSGSTSTQSTSPLSPISPSSNEFYGKTFTPQYIQQQLNYINTSNYPSIGYSNQNEDNNGISNNISITNNNIYNYYSSSSSDLTIKQTNQNNQNNYSSCNSTQTITSVPFLNITTNNNDKRKALSSQYLYYYNIINVNNNINTYNQYNIGKYGHDTEKNYQDDDNNSNKEEGNSSMAEK